MILCMTISILFFEEMLRNPDSFEPGSTSAQSLSAYGGHRPAGVGADICGAPLRKRGRRGRLGDQGIGRRAGLRGLRVGADSAEGEAQAGRLNPENPTAGKP